MRRITLLLGAMILTVGMLAGVLAAAAAPVSVKPGNAAPTQFPQAPQCVCHGMLLGDGSSPCIARL